MWRRCGISSLAALSLVLAHHTETRPSDLGSGWWGILVMAPVPFLLVGGVAWYLWRRRSRPRKP